MKPHPLIPPFPVPAFALAGLVLAAAAFTGGTDTQAADPLVTNVIFTQRAGTKLVDITFDVSDADSDELAISVEISDDSGASFVMIPITALSSGLQSNSGPTITFQPFETLLKGRTIVWNAEADFDQQFNDTMVVRVIASDATPPPGMALIPAGDFEMGDPTGAGGVASNEVDATGVPTHTVNVSSFYLDKKEVTEALWDSVRSWALLNGYSAGGLPDRGTGKGPEHPAQGMNWFDAVTWCNARSEKEGLTPVYYTGFSTVYRDASGGTPAVPFPIWTANGYRLPTEAEWEKAARGGIAGANYPWGGTSNSATPDINGGNANYSGSGDPFDNGTTPAGYYTPNVFGLHDMSGNVWEWCWDWHDNTWYGQAGATIADTRGPSTGGDRVLRGGSWISSTGGLRCANRNFTDPVNAINNRGFRSARGL